LIVVDASVLATALVDDGEPGQAVRARLSGQELVAPAIIDLQVASVVRKGLRAGMYTDDRAAFAIADLIELDLERVPHTALLRRIWEMNENVTPYDAAYVALAERLSAPLVTADTRLSRSAGTRCAIELLG